MAGAAGAALAGLAALPGPTTRCALAALAGGGLAGGGLAGCGSAAPVTWPAVAHPPVTLPLVAVHSGYPPVVEVGFGPGPGGQRRRALCALDSTRRDLVLSAALAAALELDARGDAARGRRVARLPQLELGPLDAAADGLAALDVEVVTLRDLPVEIAAADRFGRLAETPISCALGWSLWAAGALDVDPALGVALLWPEPPALPPDGASGHPLSRHGEAFGLEVLVAGKPSQPWRFALGARLSHVSAAEAERLSLPEGPPPEPGAPAPGPASRAPDAEPDPDRPAPIAWWTTVRLAGATPAPGHPPPGDPPTAAVLLNGAPPDQRGEVGYDVLRHHRLRFEPEAGLLWTAPLAPGRAWLRRHRDLPDCGEGLARCLSGTLERVEPGRARLRFDAPTVALPPRYWLEVALGQPPHRFSVWVRVDPNALRPTATIEDPRIRPEHMGAVGSPLEVVDVVPLDQPCPADACVRRD